MKEPQGITLNTYFFQVETARFQAAGKAMWKDMPVVRIHRYCSLSLEVPSFPWMAPYGTLLANRLLGANTLNQPFGSHKAPLASASQIAANKASLQPRNYRALEIHVFQRVWFVLRLVARVFGGLVLLI